MQFIKDIKRIINQNQSRSIIVTGNIHDMFFDGEQYVPLIDYLSSQLKKEQDGKQKGIIQLVYQLNNPIDVKGDMERLNEIWGSNGKPLEDRFRESVENATYALELLRQVAERNRRSKTSKNNLIFIIEAVDLLVPDSEISRMSFSDRKRVGVLHDWFSDPAFMKSGDTVILLSESRSSVHHRIARLPQMLSIDIPLPNVETRTHFLKKENKTNLTSLSIDEAATQMAGLSLHAIRQLITGGEVNLDTISLKVEEYMISQLGEGVVEFKRPKHGFKDVVGFTREKKFFQEELMPGFRGKGDAAITGAAVSGPIGGGKTYLCEACASELGMPVMVLKNIRSKWFGETDAIFERIYRLVNTFNQVQIFVDEADTQFGGVGEDAHETERRLTGKLQSMMSDVSLRGKVVWFLMTARIHRLSPDIRRPGRMDLIIPILDPEGEDRDAFLKWAFRDLLNQDRDQDLLQRASKVTANYSAAAFQMLRTQIKLKNCNTAMEAIAVAEDIIPADIGPTREYQTLQALLNCTRRSLLPEKFRTGLDDHRLNWQKRIQELESQGIR